MLPGGRGGAEEKSTRGVCAKGLERGEEGARKCHPSNPRAPPRTRIKCCEIQIINNNDNEKKSDGHFLAKKESKSIQAHPSYSAESSKKLATRLGSQQPEGPSKPLSRRRGTVPRPPGPLHPSRRSARGNPSPSARQRGRQPTNPVGLRGSPQAAPLPRSTRASPVASLLQSKQTPSPEVT